MPLSKRILNLDISKIDIFACSGFLDEIAEEEMVVTQRRPDMPSGFEFAGQVDDPVSKRPRRLPPTLKKMGLKRSG